MTNRSGYAVNCSILFTELPLLERARAASAAGFSAVEFWWPFSEPVPSDADVDAFVRAIEDADVEVVGLNFFAGDMAGGERGVLSIPARAHEFAENVPVVVEIGRRLGVRAFNALYGNREAGIPESVQDELALESLALAARAVGVIDGSVLVEPLSGADAYPLLRAGDAVAVIERFEQAHDERNLRLLADLYHMAVNGDDVPAAIERHARRIGHVQIADAPGRNEPGTGELPISEFVRQLRSVSYAGPIGLEYRPSGASADSFGWLTETF